MKQVILLIFITLSFSCNRSNQTIEKKSIEIAEIIKSGNINQLKKAFYSPEYLQKIPNFKKTFDAFQEKIKDLEIDNAKNVIVEKKYG